MLSNSEFWLILTEQGHALATGHPGQDAEGRFPNQEAATAAAVVVKERTTEDLYVVKATRTVTSIVRSSTVVEVLTPDQM